MKNYLSKKQEEKYKNIYSTVTKIENPKFEVINNGIIVPPAIDKNGKLDFKKSLEDTYGVLQEDMNNFSKFSQRHTEIKIELPKQIKVETYLDDKVVYLGLISASKMFSYGDYLIEPIARLWIFLERPELLECKVCCFIDECNKIPFGLLELFGIKKENIIKIDKNTKVREIVVPQNCFPIYGRKYSEKINFVIDKIKKNIKSKNYKKIYLSRSKLTAEKKTYGEIIIEKQFKKNGFKIIYPEKYSLKEQIAILKDCEFLAGTIGSNMHNAIFCNNNIKVAYLSRSSDINPNQIAIDKMKGFDVYNIEAHSHIFKSYYYGVPYLLEFSNNLKMFFKDNGFKCDNNTNMDNELLAFIKAFSNNKNVRNNYFNIYNDTELSILNNFRKILKRQTYQMPLYRKLQYEFKLWHYLKTGKFSKAKKYYSKLYR